MTMDLWYDLAMRERPDLDANVIDPSVAGDADAEEPAPEAKASGSVAVDFF